MLMLDGEFLLVGDRPVRFHTASCAADQFEGRRHCHDFLGGGLGGIGSIVGGITGAIGAEASASAMRDAANTAATTQRMALAQQLQMFHDQEQRTAGFAGEGNLALANQGATLGLGFPGYTDPLTGFTVPGSAGTGQSSDIYFNPQVTMPRMGLQTTNGAPVSPSSWAFDSVGPDGYTTGLSSALRNFRGSPDYAFLRNEGMRAQGQSQAASGIFASGGALRGDIAYGQGLASTDYQNFFNNVLSNNRQATGQYQDYFTNLFNANNMAQGNYTNYWNRLAGLSGIGQQTNASNATLAASTAQSIGTSANGIANSQLLGGQATGAGYVGAANSVSSALNNAAYYADRSSYSNPSSSGSSLGYTPSASTNNFDPNAAYGAGAGSAGFGGGYGM